MIDILDILEVRQRVAPLTVERYHRMMDVGLFADWDVELLDGVLVEKMSKSPLHHFLVDHLVSALRSFCSPPQWWVRQEGPITIAPSEPEPDVSVVEGDPAQYKRSNPTTARLVIEVAISSLALDRAKAASYARAGIPEFWIVCPEEGTTEVRRFPEHGTYREVTRVAADTPLASTALPGFTFHLARALAE